MYNSKYNTHFKFILTKLMVFVLLKLFSLAHNYIGIVGIIYTEQNYTVTMYIKIFYLRLWFKLDLEIVWFGYLFPYTCSSTVYTGTTQLKTNNFVCRQGEKEKK